MRVLVTEVLDERPDIFEFAAGGLKLIEQVNIERAADHPQAAAAGPRADRAQVGQRAGAGGDIRLVGVVDRLQENLASVRDVAAQIADLVEYHPLHRDAYRDGYRAARGRMAERLLGIDVELSERPPFLG